MHPNISRMSPRILLIGKNGQLGHELMQSLLVIGNVIAVDRSQVDLLKLNTLNETIEGFSPDILINAAAFTNVDKAEYEPDNAKTINAVAPGLLAQWAKSRGVLFIHFSTDFVFDGEKRTPYLETDIPRPINTYGKTKLEGEQAVLNVGGSFFIFRTGWLYSKESDSFCTRVLSWSRSQSVMRIVNDQFGSPTWARMLAQHITRILSIGGPNPRDYFFHHSGLYHLAGKGQATKFELAKRMVELDPHRSEQVVKELLPVASSFFDTPAKRPSYSVLCSEKAEREFGITIENWNESLRLMFQE